MHVRVSADGRVADVVMTGPLRHCTDEQLQADLAAAYAEALRRRASATASPRRAGRPQARVLPPARTPVFDDPIAAGRTTVVTKGWARRRPRRGEVAGRSRNDCLSVTLDPSGSFGRVSTIPGWLPTAPASLVGPAVTEAFADAYRKRDAHE